MYTSLIITSPNVYVVNNYKPKFPKRVKLTYDNDQVEESGGDVNVSDNEGRLGDDDSDADD